jgi:hypothetical protein
MPSSTQRCAVVCFSYAAQRNEVSPSHTAVQMGRRRALEVNPEPSELEDEVKVCVSCALRPAKIGHLTRPVSSFVSV